jgi:hypothetical protein
MICGAWARFFLRKRGALPIDTGFIFTSVRPKRSASRYRRSCSDLPTG